MSYSDEEMKILRWLNANDEMLDYPPEEILLKIMAQVRTLAHETLKGDKEDVICAVGDLMFCLVHYCLSKDINLVSCMEAVAIFKPIERVK